MIPISSDACLTTSGMSEVSIVAQPEAPLGKSEQPRSLRLIGLPPEDYPAETFSNCVTSLICEAFCLKETVIESTRRVVRIRDGAEVAVNALICFRSRAHRNLVMAQQLRLTPSLQLSADLAMDKVLPPLEEPLESSKNSFSWLSGHLYSQVTKRGGVVQEFAR